MRAGMDGARAGGSEFSLVVRVCWPRNMAIMSCMNSIGQIGEVRSSIISGY